MRTQHQFLYLIDGFIEGVTSTTMISHCCMSSFRTFIIGKGCKLPSLLIETIFLNISSVTERSAHSPLSLIPIKMTDVFFLLEKSFEKAQIFLAILSLSFGDSHFSTKWLSSSLKRVSNSSSISHYFLL